jgi:hypothetical protein
MDHALAVLGISTAIGTAAVFGVQNYSRKPWVEWWDNESDSDDEAVNRAGPPVSQHAETLTQRQPGRSLSSGDHKQHEQKHQRDMMTEEQLNRSSEIGQLLLGVNSDEEAREKIAELRKRAEADMKSGRHVQATRLRSVLDIIVYVLVFIAIMYLLSSEYNFNISQAARTTLPLESRAIESAWDRFDLLRQYWKQVVVPYFFPIASQSE